MGKRKKVPEDLMGSILGEAGQASSSSEQTPIKPRQGQASRAGSEAAPDTSGTISWEPHPQRTGTTFNLSKQVNKELDRLRLELQLEEDIRSSKSEITEIALQIAIEEVHNRGAESELLKRLSGNYRRL
jgi:hypothetical protein